MQVSGQLEVNASREQTFQFINDARKLALCIPGCSDLNEIQENEYEAVVKIDVAFLSLRFDVTVRLDDVQEGYGEKAVIAGKPRGLIGKLSATAELKLEELNETTTLVKYVVDQTITGKLGGIGQSVFRSKAEEMGNLFASNLKTALEKDTLGVIS